MKRAAALIAVLALAGCFHADEEAARPGQGTFTIGVVVASERDEVIARAAQLAVDEVNDAGGVRGRVRMRVVRAARNVDALVLPCDTPAPQTDVVFVLATCDSAPGAWSVGPVWALRADALAEHLRDDDVDEAAVIATRRGEELGAALAERGIETTDGVVVGSTDAVATDAGWEIAARVARRSELPVTGLDLLDSAQGIREAGEAAEGAVFATFGYPVPGSELDELYERHRLEHGARPDGSYAGLGYDAVRVVVEAIEKAGSVAAEDLAAALPGLEVGGSLGVLDYPEDGGRVPVADVALVEVRDGRLELIDKGRVE